MIPAWFGKHFHEKGWAPIVLLAYMREAQILETLEVTEAIVSCAKQGDVWLPEDRNEGCSVIGKFTQGAKSDGKRLTRRLVTDHGELDFLVRDCIQNGTLVGHPQHCPLGHVLTYYDGSQPQYAHLRASMLAYAHINLLAMLAEFPQAPRVATDSLYLPKEDLDKLAAVDVFVPAPPAQEPFDLERLIAELEGFVPGPAVGTTAAPVPTAQPAQWRDE